ncbi:MAG TPA: CheR family methyltransferase [Anaerolineae bacterium]|nr:CheR family methyltransferase [Anaerolineae bacterium]
MTTPPASDFEALLEYLARTRGFDFTAYKPASLMRRIQKRMQMLSLEAFNDYIDYLEVHPDEFAALFNMILINVTAFFRDPPAWEYIAQDVLPRILEAKEAQGLIRVWSAGCASGEEAYTIAMLLAEALGTEPFSRRVKIYATDVDEDALSQARLAAYTEHQVQGIPPHLLEKYFASANGRFSFNKDLRRAVIFGRHDLIQDAPISHIDLLICRNTLMYLNAETQSKILKRFDFALNGGGYLFLGKAEVLLTRSNAFTPIDLKRRVFTKVFKAGARERLAIPQVGVEEMNHNSEDHVRIRELAVDADPVASIVIDATGALAAANEQARGLFNLTPAEIGRPYQDLEVSYRPVELRAVVEQVFSEHRPRSLKDIEWFTRSGERRYLDVQIIPLLNRERRLAGVKIVFNDVSRYRRLQEELQQSRQELETMNEELQSSNEELETTNEELQSTVEELETTNEELQSTNEEMETMNEELQSTNEELEATNTELQQRTDELNQLNAFLGSILSSLRDGVAVVDRNLQVLAWNYRAEDLWGLRADEVRGKNFLNLDIGLPAEQIMHPIRDCLAGRSEHHEMELDAVNRRGKAIHVQVTISRLDSAGQEAQGAILVMQENKVDGS